ncbi:MAG: hypothetical protein AB1725_06320 [Armatimonadota bacterium]
MADLLDRIKAQQGRVTDAFLVLGVQVIGPPQYRSFSGFVVHLADRYVWITAAHVLQVLNVAVNEGLTVECWWIRPGSPRRVRFEFSTVYRRTFAQLCAGAEDIESFFGGNLDHVDIGFVLIPSEAARHLHNDGLVAFEWDEIRRYAEEEVGSLGEPEQFCTYLFGVPEAAADYEAGSRWFKALEVSPQKEVKGHITLIPVNWQNLHGDSVDGMSGGPVVVLGGRVPVLIGVQSMEFGAAGRIPTELCAVQSDGFLLLLRAFLEGANPDP